MDNSNQFFAKLPEDILPIIFNFSNLDTFRVVRILSHSWKQWCNSEIDPITWNKIIRNLPRGFCAVNLRVKSRMTYTAVKERRCSICYGSYRGKVDSAFGTWAHPRCRREKVINTYYLWFLYCVNYEQLSRFCTIPMKHLEGNGGYRYTVIWPKRHWCIKPEDTLEGNILALPALRDECMNGVEYKINRWEEGIKNHKMINMERYGMYKLIKLIGLENV